MLPAAHRLTDAASFREASRRGRRASSRTLVTHLLVLGTPEGPGQVGFVVSKAVGNSVVRGRVQRRLRHVVREFLPALGGTILVVRAQPAAAASSSAQLRTDVESCLSRLGVDLPLGAAS